MFLHGDHRHGSVLKSSFRRAVSVFFFPKDGTLMNSAHELPEAHREVDLSGQISIIVGPLQFSVENTTPLFQQMHETCVSVEMMTTLFLNVTVFEVLPFNLRKLPFFLKTTWEVLRECVRRDIPVVFATGKHRGPWVQQLLSQASKSGVS